MRIPVSSHNNIETAARIAVMTPFRAQRKILKEELKVFERDVEVITIDSAQGLEYDLVVLSMVKTSYTPFLADAKRANVAISRAKYGLVIVGDKKTLSHTKYWKEVIHAARRVRTGDSNLLSY
jgi:superfamily I DNA and/or RNA helicase